MYLIIPKNVLGIILSKIYWLSTGYKSIAQHTAQNFKTSNCHKIDDGNPNNSANTDIYASNRRDREPNPGFRNNQNIYAYSETSIQKQCFVGLL